MQISVADVHRLAILDDAAGAIRLDMRGTAFDIALADAAPNSALAAVVILDEQTPDRLNALTRFWAAATGRRIPPDPRLTAQRKQRARQMLRTVDAREAGATYRAIAQSLFPQHDTDAAVWVGSAIRETTIRLVRDGMKLVRGGYRMLLCRPRRDR